MAAGETSEGTEAPGGASGGLPQLNANTYPSQLFWLAVTFAIFFVAMWKLTLPRIGGAIEDRRYRIAGDLDAAEQLRKDAASSLQAYESALAAARGRAGALAADMRKRVVDEIEGLKNSANATSQAATTEAEARIAASRNQALQGVGKAASEAAADIVERLIGERVDPNDALRAVEAR